MEHLTLSTVYFVRDISDTLRSNMDILLMSRILNRQSESGQLWSAIQTMLVLLYPAEVTESLICGTREEWGRGRGSHTVTGMLVTSHLGRNCRFRLIFLARRVSLEVARKGISNLENFIVRESSMGW